MKKYFYLFVLVVIGFLFVQCERKKIVLRGEENGYVYVNLGLSVKWATCNVGADMPEEYGGYFAWGEVEPKKTYGWSTYKYGSDADQLTKYCNDSNYGKDGFVDNKIVLDLEDDVAAVNWGGSWRMPTKAEEDELRDNCTWIWTTENGVNGYIVTSNVEGYTDCSIFLPAAGCMYEDTLYHAGVGGYYWSSSLYTNNSDLDYYLYFNSDYEEWNYNFRFRGHSVRPVCP